MSTTGPLDDSPRTKSPELEHKREWDHRPWKPGDPNCPRVTRKVYTDTNKIPYECKSCPSDEWLGGVKVVREKEHKRVIIRDGKKVE